MARVVFLITNLPNKVSATTKRLAFAAIEGTSVKIESQLPEDSPLNDHLVWLWGVLQG